MSLPNNVRRIGSSKARRSSCNLSRNGTNVSSLVSWPGDHRRRSPATLGRRIGQKHLYDTELRTIFQNLFEFGNSAKRYSLVSDKRRRLNIPRDHQRLNTPVA